MGQRCTVEGTVQSVIFQNEENGYTVLTLIVDGQEEPVTVVGCIPCAAAGEGMTVTGVWVEHPTYGPQLTAESVERRMPQEARDVAAYLGSGILKGVGPATAQRLVDRFGADTLRVIEEEPERLQTLKGITAKRAMELSAALRALTGLRQVMEFLARYDLPVHLAMAVQRTYGDGAMQALRDDPYLLSRRQYGVDFAVTDDIAEYLATQLKSNVRQLEGAVRRMQALCMIDGDHPSLIIAQTAIRDIRNDNQPVPITVERIINEVARTLSVTPEDIRSNKRSAPISQARQVAEYVVRNITGLPMKAIGEEFGTRDHSTVVYALQKVEQRMNQDPSFKGLVQDIIKNISEK